MLIVQQVNFFVHFFSNLCNLKNFRNKLKSNVNAVVCCKLMTISFSFMFLETQLCWGVSYHVTILSCHYGKTLCWFITEDDGTHLVSTDDDWPLTGKQWRPCCVVPSSVCPVSNCKQAVKITHNLLVWHVPFIFFVPNHFLMRVCEKLFFSTDSANKHFAKVSCIMRVILILKINKLNK